MTSRMTRVSSPTSMILGPAPRATGASGTSAAGTDASRGVAPPTPGPAPRAAGRPAAPEARNSSNGSQAWASSASGSAVGRLARAGKAPARGIGDVIGEAEGHPRPDLPEPL